MKLKTDEFKELAKRKGYRSDFVFWKSLGGGKSAYKLVKDGFQVGYEFMKNLYNTVGETEMLKVVDFEEETIDGFKAKYMEIGGTLY